MKQKHNTINSAGGYNVGRWSLTSDTSSLTK